MRGSGNMARTEASWRQLFRSIIFFDLYGFMGDLVTDPLIDSFLTTQQKRSPGYVLSLNDDLTLSPHSTGPSIHLVPPSEQEREF